MKTKTFAASIAHAGRTIWGISLLRTVLDTLVCFLLFAVVLTIAGQNVAYGLIPAAVYGIAAVLRTLWKSDIIGAIEDKHVSLDGKLSTAYDNRGESNLIVEGLISDVSEEMENVETSAFIDPKEVYSKGGIAIALIFMMLAITVFDIRGVMSDLIDLDGTMRYLQNAMREHGLEYQTIEAGDERWDTNNLTTEKEDEKLGAEPGGERPGFNMGPIPGGGGGVGYDRNDDIYGNPSSAAIGGENVDVSLHPEYGGDIEIEEHDTKADFTITTGADEAQQAEICEECAIGPGYEELVKRYFEKVLGEA